MASLVKPWIIRYLDADGRQVRKGTPGAIYDKQRAAKWYAQVEIEGRRRRIPLCKDKSAARQMLAKIERDLERGNVGLTDPFAKHRKAPLETHILAFEAHLRSQEVSAEYLKEHIRRLRLVVNHGQARTLADLRPDLVVAYLGTLDTEKTGVSMRNNYIGSAKAFTRWCVDTKRLADDPLASLKRLPPSIRRVRRALTEDELVRLVKAARERPLLDMRTIRSGTGKGQRVERLKNPATEEKMKRLGWERALIWKTLVLTGLRRGELEALEVRHLTLTGARPCLALPGSATKNKKLANLPLRADLVRDLKAWLKATGKTGKDRVFAVIQNLYKVLREDLAWASITYKDAQGRTVDVHALRHTTATHMSRGKVAPRAAQRHMRHEDIRLTMQTYTDADLLDEAEALKALPKMPLPEG